MSSWGSGLSIWIEIVLWKQGLLFLEPFKITDRTGRIWYLEGLYYGIKHQIVLKLFELHPGVVDWQSELKLFCGNRDFSFESHPKSQTEDVEYEIWRALLFNTTSDCLETAWASSWGSGLSIWIEIVLWKQGLLFLEPFKITDRTGRIWYWRAFIMELNIRLSWNYLSYILG